MSSVSVREFSYNPSGMFARVEQGEILEVACHEDNQDLEHLKHVKEEARKNGTLK